ncbi:MAG: hydroxylamine reductase [Thermodesulfobacteriota bacterium]
MFCYQCEQTAKGKACDMTMGVCGKTSEVAALQDLLVHALQGLGACAAEARRLGIVDRPANSFFVKALFSTLTNVDFDPERFLPLIRQAVALREELRSRIRAAGGQADLAGPAASFTPGASLAELVAQGEAVGLPGRGEAADLTSLKHITLFGMKGVAAYADHAQILGQEDDAVFAFLEETMADLGRTDLAASDWINRALTCGAVNLRAMELLDAGNTGTYGHPQPTAVPLGHKAGHALLVSGHDLADLEAILEQTAGKGIHVYTHGEMLPTHGYPGLKKHPHFYGHYGTAWQNQAKEFDAFPGAIVMTTNCMQRPRESYQDRIFTAGLVGWPGVAHITGRDFGPAIARSLASPGFPADEDRGTVNVGFARQTVLGVAGQVIQAVKDRAIRHFFLVAGCDGAKPGRNYYTEFVEKVPADCVVLTLACGKFRFFDKKLGEIGGIPRLLDVGQCNDAYSAIQIASALAGAFGCGVNDLPLSLVLSWYEQKAVAILLTLFHLGIKNIRLGPSLPAFVSPGVLKVLVDTFAVKPISTPEADLAAILG